MPQNKKRNASTENGNIFVFILVGIFLFGALIYTFTRTSETGSSNFSKQEAKIAAQEILNYARLVENAVDRVRQNGCSENEISFENIFIVDYINHNAPSDNSCHVFHPNGGDITMSQINNSFLDTTHSGQFSYGYPFFSENGCVRGIGKDNGNTNASAFCNNPNSNGEDLLVIFPYIKNEICSAINLNLYKDSTIPRDSAFDYGIGNGAAFTGNFNGEREIGNTSNSFDGKYSFCHNSANSQDIYTFYHVLLAR